MKARPGKQAKEPVRPKKVEIRPDLENGDKGTDLSYLNEFPQFSADEGVKAGVPPPREPSDRPEPPEADNRREPSGE